jgi:hypothetical protein
LFPQSRVMHTRAMKKQIFLAIAVTALTATAFGKSHNHSSFDGTWRRDDGSETMTISVHGNNAIISYSSGSPDSGTINGNMIDYQGVMKTNGQLVKTTGTLELQQDGNTIVKRRAVYYPDGLKTEGFSFIRVSSGGANSSESSVSGSSSSSFGGNWRLDADRSHMLTISVHGRDAVMNYSRGTPDSGTVRGNVIEFQGVSPRNVNGEMKLLKATGTIEITSNGNTLILRESIDYPNNETRSEEHTYSRMQ